MGLQGQGFHFGIGDRLAGPVEGVKQESGDGQPDGGGGSGISFDSFGKMD